MNGEHVAGPDRDLELLEQEVTRRRRNDKRQKWGLFILAMLLAVALTIIAAFLYNTENKLVASDAKVATEQGEKKEIAKDAQQLLCREGGKEIYDRELCEYWARVAGEPPAMLPETTGPSQDELIAAFRAYCAQGDNCRGRDGRDPTPEDMAAAFVAWCGETRCSGEKGEKGEKGENAEPLAPEYAMVLAAVTEVCATGVCTGAPGKDGVDGQNATPEMVAVQVAQFCANDNCRGPKGDKGDNVTLVSWTDPRTGDKYTCTPNPPGSTTLTCSVEPGFPPRPDPPLLGVLP